LRRARTLLGTLGCATALAVLLAFRSAVGSVPTTPTDEPVEGAAALIASASTSHGSVDATEDEDVQSAALRHLFTAREKAGQLVLWNDSAQSGPVFTRLHAAVSLVAHVERLATPGLPVSAISSGAVQQLFREHPDGWAAFFARYAGAPGIVELGAVRYDSATRENRSAVRVRDAALLVGRSCGEQCAMAWRVSLRRAGDAPWRVESVTAVPLPPERPHARFVRASAMLLANLSAFTVLDTRGWWAFARGHLPGAVRIDWEDYREGRGRTGRLPVQLDALAERLALLGVDDTRPVLVYGDAADGWGEEGRIAWMLRYLGHPEVAILDGGMAAWRGAGGPTESRTVKPVPGHFTAAPVAALRAEADDVERARGTSAVVLDTRSEAEWNGSRKYLPARTGRIPGAVHLHWRDLLSADGTLDRSAGARARLAALGVTDSTGVIAYCVGGVRSAFVTLALRELGFTDVRNYDGSWYEWAGDDSRPVEKP
jgi:thiosulfate/3-mercaptopyruvate sulfurtransferase